MKKGSLFLSLLLMFQLAGNSASDLNGVSVSNVKVPFYRGGALQSMIFAEKAEYRSQLLYGHNVIINMLQKKVNPDQIHNDWQLRLYPLDSSLADVARFWAGRLHYCDAVIYTPEGALNQSERSAASDREVKLRSPLLDLDGVGFASDFKRRQIKINSHVKIVMRGKNADPRMFGKKIPEKYEFMRGTSDMLHMDTAQRRIMLLGNVVVTDKQIKLTCDRLTVVLGKEAKLKDKSSMDFSGVKMLYADGNVKVEKCLPAGASAADTQELKGDHLVYDVEQGQLTVSGDKHPPEIRTGKGLTLRGKELVFFREKQQLIIPRECWMCVDTKGEKRYLISDYGNFNFATGICDFLGNVRASAPQNELACKKMRIFLERSKKNSAPSPVADTGSPLNGTGTIDTGAMEFKRALCKGNLKLFRREKQGFSTLAADEADLNYAADKAIFNGNVKSVSGSNTLTTSCLTVNLKPSEKDPRNKEITTVEAAEQVKITGTPDAKGEISVLTADRGSFDYKADRIDFSGNVKSSRGKSCLTSDRLILYLGVPEANAQPVSIPGVASGVSEKGKTLKHVVASGNARMQDEANTLSADKLEFFFAPALKGAPELPGMFQSGSLRLTRVTSDGNVKLSSGKNAEPTIADSKESKREKKTADAGVMLGRNAGFRELTSQHMESDLSKYTTVFSDKVTVTDGSSRMECQKLEFFAKPQRSDTPGAVKVDADPDADPFELPAENSVPSTIALGNGLALEKAVATEDVVINRRPNAVDQGETVYCDRAAFNSSAMTIECTSTDGRRPRAEGKGKTHTADKFTIYLKDERIESTGDAVIQ